MYDEVMQLIALAKNDERYFKRIEELKEKQMELAQVMEIAKTLGEADKHLAMARQQAEAIIEAAKKEAEELKNKANAYIEEQKALSLKIKGVKDELTVKVESAVKKAADLKEKEDYLDKAIKEHRELSVARSAEYEAALKVKQTFETKLKQMKELANT